jgi:hypothetical protein
LYEGVDVSVVILGVTVSGPLLPSPSLVVAEDLRSPNGKINLLEVSALTIGKDDDRDDDNIPSFMKIIAHKRIKMIMDGF